MRLDPGTSKPSVSKVDDYPFAGGSVVTNPEHLTPSPEAVEKFYPNTSEADASSWPFRFNPPLHKVNRPVRVDFGSDTKGEQESLDAYFDEHYASTGADNYRTQRLGRIVMAETVLGSVGTRNDSDKVRWGFRFLYNPEKIITNTGAYDQVTFNTGDAASLILSGVNQNFQTHTIPILINRIPDVQAGKTGESTNLRKEDYEPLQGMRGEDLNKLVEQGTMWDLEFLFRVCNGIWNTHDLGDTGNLGMLQPNPSYLILGPGIKHYGFVQAVEYQHTRFSGDMVPMLTEVTIVFKRSIHLLPEQADAWLAGMGPYGGQPRKPKSYNTYTHDEAAWGKGEGSGLDPTYSGNKKDAPLPGYKVTYPWGSKNSGYQAKYHTGDDYGTAPAGTPVTATRGGKVVLAGWNFRESDYGITVVVETLGGTPNGVRHMYCHLSAVSVSLGQEVEAGQVVGKVGNTGRSKGAHLHYEERVAPDYKYPGREPLFNSGK
jgi:hypothetical protein